MSGDHQLCTFQLDGHLFGVRVDCVQEIIRFQQMTPVPVAPACVRGLINLRGQIVLALELREILGLCPRPVDRVPMNVVVRAGDEVVSLLVDEIGEVQDVEEDAFEPPPEMLSERIRGLTRGVYKLPERLLLVLDAEKAIQLEDRVHT